MSSSSCRRVPCSLLQPRASLIWILLKSAIPVIVGLLWKVTLSLKPITDGRFHITFALLKGCWEMISACGTDYPFQIKIWTQKWKIPGDQRHWGGWSISHTDFIPEIQLAGSAVTNETRCYHMKWISLNGNKQICDCRRCDIWARSHIVQMTTCL